MPEKLVTVARLADYIEAEMAKQLLEDSGIKAALTGENVTNTFTAMPGVTDLELQTFESDADRAREILESRGQRQE